MAGAHYAGHRILDAMQAATAYADEVFRQIRNAAPSEPGRILDFGAGNGMFAERSRALWTAIDCVEPDPDMRARLTGIANRTFADVADLPPWEYDFIYTVNVLEHIHDLQGVVDGLYRSLAPGGTLFVFVPAFNLLWTSLDDEVDHVQRFTMASLAAPLERAGFVVTHRQYFDSLGFFAALAVRCAEKLGAFRYNSGTVGFYDRYLFPLSKVLDRACRGFFGKNILVRAHKPLSTTDTAQPTAAAND